MQHLKVFESRDARERLQPDNTLSAEIRQAIRERLTKAAHEGRVQCAGALGIARELGVRSSDVGEIADEMRIKISRCQLGCF